MQTVITDRKIRRDAALRKVGTVVLWLFGALLLLGSIFPFFWVVISSFKPLAEIQSIRFHFFPQEWTAENYVNLFAGNSVYIPRGVTFAGSLAVTFAVAVIALVLSLIVNSLAAYAFARLEFPGKKLIWALYAVNMFVPNIAIQIPCYYVVSQLGLIDNFLVLVLPGVVYVWSIFYYRQYYLGIPRSLEEAALIDGCSRFGMYLRLFLPLSVTPFIIMGLSVFQGFWNSYIWPSMTVQGNPALYQVNQIVAYFRNTQGTAWDMLLAATVITCIPLVVILLIMQRYIMQGIKITGIK